MMMMICRSQKSRTAEYIENDLDDATVLSKTVEYKECAPSVPYRRDLLDVSITDIARIALEVVEAEGPIHTEEVARRIREAFGLQKTGKRILAHVRAGLNHLSQNASAVRDGDFWSAAGRDLPAGRNRR